MKRGSQEQIGVYIVRDSSALSDSCKQIQCILKVKGKDVKLLLHIETPWLIQTRIHIEHKVTNLSCVTE